jgi:integrase
MRGVKDLALDLEMILFAINTGLRTSDIFNLQWMEVDIEQQRPKKIVKKERQAVEPTVKRYGFQHHPST